MGLAVLSAISELVGRFRDAPVRVVISWPGVLFLALNAALAGVVLAVLRAGEDPASAQAAGEQVLLAGFGARIITRLKVVGYRARDGTQNDVGPGAVFEKVIEAVSRAADRDRASDRLKNIRPLLDGVKWGTARSFFTLEMAAAMQDLSDEEKTEINRNLELIDSMGDVDEDTRVDLLGYLVLDFAGQAFLESLVGQYQKRFPPAAVAASTPHAGAPAR